MKHRLSLLITLAALLTPLSAQASCDLEYTACESACKVKYISDDGGKAGCTSKCFAEKGACLTKKGAEKTAEAGEKAWDNTKSFFKALTEE